MAGMRDMLEGLATKGYARLDTEDDPRALAVCKLDVGSIATRSTFAEGVPPEAWQGGQDFLLVPASHSVRMAIAKALRAPWGGAEGGGGDEK